MSELTVDTSVIMLGTGMSESGDYSSCKTVLDAIAGLAIVVALDDKGKIRQEYERKMGEQSTGRLWLKGMAERDKLQVFPWKKLPKGTRVKLQEAHFDPHDYPFVETAALTETKRLVEEDDDYSPAVKKILKKGLGVVAERAKETCQWLDAGI